MSPRALTPPARASPATPRPRPTPTSTRARRSSGATQSFIETADLTVDANQFFTRYEKSPYAHGGFLVGHHEPTPGGKDALRDIFWESTVIMLGEPNPELVIDATGKIVKIVNVIVTDENGTAYGLDSTIGAGHQIHVGDIQYDRGGLARFRANDLTGAPDSRIWGNAGLFDYQETWDYVRILSSSDRTLVLHLIDVVNGKQSPMSRDRRRRRPGPDRQPGQQRLAQRVGVRGDVRVRRGAQLRRDPGRGPQPAARQRRELRHRASRGA